MTAVNSLRTLGKSPRLDLWAMPELVLPPKLARTKNPGPEGPGLSSALIGDYC